VDTRPTADYYFMTLAEAASTRSKDPNTKVGAVITRPDQTVLSTGYNGFPRKIEDTEKRLNTRDIKLRLTLHAEMNALLFANESTHNCSIYVYPFQPCLQCALAIIQSGISRVVTYKTEPKERWEESFLAAISLFEEAGVQVDLLDPK